jgi:hypothetical protein
MRTQILPHNRLTPAYRTITWAETAELVKLDGQRVAVWLLDGSLVEISAEELRALVTGHPVTIETAP